MIQSSCYNDHVAKNYLAVPSHYAVTTDTVSVPIVSSDANAFSDLLYIGGSSIVAVFVPGSNSGAAWVPANILVYGAPPNGLQVSAANYAPVYKTDGTPYVIEVPATIPATGIIVNVNLYDFVGLDCVQFQSVTPGSPATPVVQTNSPSLVPILIGNGTF